MSKPYQINLGMGWIFVSELHELDLGWEFEAFTVFFCSS
jgi:hypothetical protein